MGAKRGRRGFAIAAGVVVLATAASLTVSPAAGYVEGGSIVTASRLLEELRVVEEVTTPLPSSYFPADVDWDADGCGRTFDVLLRSANGPRTDGCSFTEGRWLPKYAGWPSEVVEVNDGSVALEVQNLIAPREAWESGGQNWSDLHRRRFMSDVDEVRAQFATTASIAHARGENDPAEWLPEDDSCSYAGDWIAMKFHWSLAVDAAERYALEQVLQTCPHHIVSVPALQQVPQVPPPVVTEVYRFWSPVSSSHFFTNDPAERDAIVQRWSTTWAYEGARFTAYRVEVPGTTRPLYRFWNASTRSHFYTPSEQERAEVIRRWPDIWAYEGVGFHVLSERSSVWGSLPVHRFYSPSLGRHFYTASDAERSGIMQRWPDVWTYEGVAYSVPMSGMW